MPTTCGIVNSVSESARAENLRRALFHFQNRKDRINMSTAAQTAANRENAKLSTGPRTEEGKAASSRNNTRHGLTARGLIVLPGQEPAFHELETDLRASLHPQGPLQETFFMRILECSWNLHRCRLAEAHLYENSGSQDIDPLNDDENAAKYARIQKYARQNENSLAKCLRELSKLQNEIQYRYEAYPLTEEQIEDSEQFNQTPHSLSEACNFQKVMDSCLRQQSAKSKIRSQHFKSQTAAVVAQIHALGGPGDFQFEPDESESNAQAAGQAA
ncbi:MAG TPA: hypothetical protein VGL53_24635 [Bryobacteraceae bacterium]